MHQENNCIAKPSYVPADYDRIKVVGTMDGLLDMAWENANAILYPRSNDKSFQELAPHFKDLAKLIQSKCTSKESALPRIRSMRDLMIYHKKSMPHAQKKCLDYIIADVEKLQKQCAQTWELRIQKYAPQNFHFDGCEIYPYPHTIITTYFGKATRWVRDEDVDYKTGGLLKPKHEAVIHALQAGDICKFDNDGQQPFCHAANTGFRMTLVVR